MSRFWGSSVGEYCLNCVKNGPLRKSIPVTISDKNFIRNGTCNCTLFYPAKSGNRTQNWAVRTTYSYSQNKSRPVRPPVPYIEVQVLLTSSKTSDTPEHLFSRVSGAEASTFFRLLTCVQCLRASQFQFLAWKKKTFDIFDD